LEVSQFEWFINTPGYVDVMGNSWANITVISDIKLLINFMYNCKEE
jgi:hypothetical protein